MKTALFGVHAAVMTLSLCGSGCQPTRELELDRARADAIASEVARQSVTHLIKSAKLLALVQGVSGNSAPPDSDDLMAAAIELSQTLANRAITAVDQRGQPVRSLTQSISCQSGLSGEACAADLSRRAMVEILKRLSEFSGVIDACRQSVPLGTTLVEIVEARESFDTCVRRGGFGDEVAAVLRAIDKG